MSYEVRRRLFRPYYDAFCIEGTFSCIDEKAELCAGAVYFVSLYADTGIGKVGDKREVFRRAGKAVPYIVSKVQSLMSSAVLHASLSSINTFGSVSLKLEGLICAREGHDGCEGRLVGIPLFSLPLISYAESAQP